MHFCNWLGVKCGCQHQRVTVLDLQGHKLRGTLSLYIGNLSFLRSIFLRNNSFYGGIPQEIGHLFRPQGLYLTNNTMKGEIPSSLSNCSNIRFLVLLGNKLKGKIPTELGSLMKLKLLQLGANNLVGGIPPSLGNLSSLTNFAVAYNNLVGNIPDAIRPIKWLRFSGPIPTSLFNATQLQRIDLENEISGTIPGSLMNLVNLIVLDLNENHFTTVIPTTFGKFEKMASIGLENGRSLQILDISQNDLHGSIPQQLIGTSSLPLTYLNLSHNSFTGKLPFEVGNLKNINQMDISNNNLFGEIPKSIGNCLILEYLYLQGNSFHGAIPSSMASLKGLQLLDVSQNNLSGPIPGGLEKLLFLEKLNLSFNNFEGKVPIEGVFKNISAVSLIGNTKLCGGIPKLQLPKCPVNVMKLRKSIGFKLAIIILSIVQIFLLFSSFLVWMKKSRKKSPSMVSIMDLLLNVSYKELYQATSGFSPSNLIGLSNFSSIYKGFIHSKERSIAGKVLNLQQKGASQSFMVECNASRNIRHRNLVKILTCCSSMDHNGNEFKALVFEFMTNGSLDFWLHQGLDNENQSRNLSLLQRLNVAIDVAFAIDYLHSHSVQPIICCDLKPSNVLLDNDMVAHVSDFEYGMGGEASIEADLYSYGILLLEMFLGKRPTDNMFKDGLNLHNFAKMALPEKLVQIVDPILLPREVHEAPTAIVAAREYNNGNEIQVDVGAGGISNLCQMDPNVHKCFVSILEIGLACSM
ncbi:hypothetical protein ACB098_06G142900 [Castanea mollissima]